MTFMYIEVDVELSSTVPKRLAYHSTSQHSAGVNQVYLFNNVWNLHYNKKALHNYALLASRLASQSFKTYPWKSLDAFFNFLSLDSVRLFWLFIIFLPVFNITSVIYSLLTNFMESTRLIRPYKSPDIWICIWKLRKVRLGAKYKFLMLVESLSKYLKLTLTLIF